MIKLVVTNEKNLELYELEKVHVGENKFGYYLIFLPEMLNGYNLSDCEVKLIQIFEDNTSVAINVDTTQETRPIKEFITLDATAQAQTVTLSVLVTHNGDVIGKTNQKTYQVYPTKNFTPIDPREELDEIIAELRADKAELEETVSEQAAEITEKNTQITELSGEVTDLNSEVTELTSDNTRLENLTDTQRETIQNMLDNPPQPKLYTPPVITPSGSVQQVNPLAGYDGLNNAVVDRVTAEGVDFHSEWYKEGEECLGEVGTYNPFPYNSVGGIYITEVDEDGYPKEYLIKNLPKGFIRNNEFPAFYVNTQDVKSRIRKITFDNCPDIFYLQGNAYGSGFFEGMLILKEVQLPESLMAIRGFEFTNAQSLSKLNLPNSLSQNIGFNAFGGCVSLEDVTMKAGFNCDGLNLAASTLYSVETIVSWLEALADRTGQTAYTLTMGTTNLNKLTAEQKAIAINKNWNLA